MNNTVDIHLGDPVELWAGLKPRFLSSGLAWRVPQGRPLKIESASIPLEPVEWDPPILSLHDNVPDVLSHIFDYEVSPMVGLDGPLALPSGALMEGNSLAELEARFGLDLTRRPAAAYLLVRLDATRGTRFYTPEYEGLNRKIKIMQWLTQEGQSALARLRLTQMRHEGVEFHGDLTARQARRYLDYFHDFGTHLIRALRYGERLFQVFEVDGEHLAGLRAAFGAAGPKVCGPESFSMVPFTRAPWVRAASPILSASASTAVAELAQHAIWIDEAGKRRCLLAPQALLTPRRNAVLDMLPAQSIIGVSFACQALYLEDHRADAWSRIMRAGLRQRFSTVRDAGWRAREPVSLIQFMASAALTGEEALCKPPGPALTRFAFVLDLTASSRVVQAPAASLALFAATNPGAGRAADLAWDCGSFHPQGLKIPFLDGSVCITDNKGERSCLIEGVWLGSARDGRPAITDDPAAVDEALLACHAPQLAAYLLLMGQLEGIALEATMRRCSAWIAEVSQGKASLVSLRWQALLAARARLELPTTIVLDDALKADLAGLLRQNLNLLALHPDSPDLKAASQNVARQLSTLYGALADSLPVAELDRRSLAAGAALERSFAKLRKALPLPEEVAVAFCAGAALCQPPDLHRLPHALLPGDNAHALLWNALLGLRTRYAECRAILLALQGETAKAITLLEQEIITGRDCPINPANQFARALDILLPQMEAAERDMLLAGMADLLQLHISAHLRQRANASMAMAESGPQLQRLVLVLKSLQLCRLAGIAMAPFERLAPIVLAGQIDAALTAIMAPA